MYKKRQLGRISCEATIDAYDYDRENDSLVQKNFNNTIELNNQTVIYLNFPNKSKLTSQKIDYGMITLWIDESVISNVEDNSYKISLYPVHKVYASYEGISDIVRDCEYTFSTEQPIDIYVIKKYDRCIKLKFPKEEVISTIPYLIKVECLTLVPNVFLKVIDDLNDYKYPIISIYTKDDNGYYDKGPSRTFGMSNNIGLKVNTHTLKGSFEIPLGEAQSNHLPIPFKIYSGKTYIFKDSSKVGINTFHNYEYYIEDLNETSFDNLVYGQEKYKIYYPWGQEIIFYYAEEKNEYEDEKILPWEVEDVKQDLKEYDFCCLEDSTVKLVYNKETGKYRLEDQYKNKTYFNKSTATQISNIYHFNIETIEYCNNKKVTFTYNENNHDQLMKINGDINEVNITYFSDNRIKQINYVNELYNTQLLYENYELATGTTIYRIKSIIYNETNIDGKIINNRTIELSYDTSADLPYSITSIYDNRTLELLEIMYFRQSGKIYSINNTVKNSFYFSNYTFEEYETNTRVIGRLPTYVIDVFDAYGDLAYQINHKGQMIAYGYDKILDTDNEIERKLVSRNSTINNSLNLLYNHKLYDEINAFNSDSKLGWKIRETTDSVQLSEEVKEGNNSIQLKGNSSIERTIEGTFYDGLSLFFNYKTNGDITTGICKITINNGKTYVYNLKNTNGTWQEAKINGIEANEGTQITIIIDFQGTELYLDDIEIGYEIITNRNLLHNGYFEFGKTNNQITSWEIENGDTTSMSFIEIEDKLLHPYKNFGSYVLCLNSETNNNPVTVKTIINRSGKNGDSYTISSLIKGTHLYGGERIDIEVYFDEEKAITLRTNSYVNEWQPLYQTIQATKDYNTITVKIINRTTSSIYIDGVQLFQEKVGTYFTYNLRKEVEKVNNLSDTIYEYNDYGQVTYSRNGDGDGSHYIYDEFGKRIEAMNFALQNQMNYFDENGNIIKQEKGFASKKIINKIGYQEANRLLPSVKTNERGQTNTFSYYDNFLVKDIIESRNSFARITNYQYNEKNQLTSIIVQDEEDTQKLLYGYIDENLIDQLSYINSPGNNQILYDNDYKNGIYTIAFQEVGASVEPSTFIKYEYSIHGDLVAKNYGVSGTIYSFENNNDGTLNNVMIGTTLKYHYVYDSAGKLVSIIDSANNIVNQYYYDCYNNLIGFNNGIIEIQYSYDKWNNIRKSNIIQNMIERSYEYYFEKDYYITQFEILMSHLAMQKKLDYLDGEHLYKGIGAYGMTFDASGVSRVSSTRHFLSLSNGKKMTVNILEETDTGFNILVNKDRYTNKEKEDFLHHKWLYMWIRLNEKCIDYQFMKLYYKNQGTKEITQIDISLDSSGFLKVETMNALTTSEVRISNDKVPLSKWIQLVISIRDAGGTTNQAILKAYINGIDTGINRLVPCVNETNINNSHYLYQLEMLTSASSSYTIAYLGVGGNPYNSLKDFDNEDLNFNLASQLYLYNMGIKTIENQKIDNQRNLIYYNANAYKDFEVFTLLGNEEGSKGSKPIDIQYLNIESQNKINKIFDYNEEGFYYQSIEGQEGTLHQNNSKLVYKFDHNGTWNIGVFFKVEQLESTTLRVLLSLKNMMVKVYLSGNSLCFMNSQNMMSVATFEYSKWNHVMLQMVDNIYKLYLNGALVNTSSPNATPPKPLIVAIGCNYNENNNTSNYVLNGKVKMFCFSQIVIDEARILAMYQKGHEYRYQRKFDELGRLMRTYLYSNDKQISSNTNYKYLDSTLNGYTTSLLSNYSSINGIAEIISYSDDNLITSISTGYQYRYDGKQRLILEYNSNTKLLTLYTYDKNGNITSKKKYYGTLTTTQIDALVNDETIPSTLTYKEIDKYEYKSQISDSSKVTRHYKDLLTKYEVYDIIEGVETLQKSEINHYAAQYYGNPFILKGYTATFEGRRLIRLANTTSGEDIQYQYNERGLRTKKYVINSEGMEEYDYYYEGDRLTSYRNEEGKMIYLHYDENNEAIGFHYEGEEYFYVRDTTGNINKIMDVEGKIVASYSYNAWGEVISEGGNNNLHKINQLMYKGYVYDREINLYYCKSRYYNPEWCRFINADDVDYINSEYLNGLNLYAYCGNDPINKYDPSGHIAITSFLIGLGISALIGAVAGGISYAASEIVSYAFTGEFSWSWASFAGSVLGGAISGTLAAIPVVNAMVVAGVSGFASTAIGMGLENVWEGKDYTFGQIMFASTINGLISSAAGGLFEAIPIKGLTSGRGSYSAITKQITTKFFNGTIKRITYNTFSKMLTYNMLGSMIGAGVSGVMDATGANDLMAN